MKGFDMANNLPVSVSGLGNHVVRFRENVDREVEVVAYVNGYIAADKGYVAGTLSVNGQNVLDCHKSSSSKSDDCRIKQSCHIYFNSIYVHR